MRSIDIGKLQERVMDELYNNMPCHIVSQGCIDACVISPEEYNHLKLIEQFDKLGQRHDIKLKAA